MASNIDITKPVTGNATTQSVRDNFATAKSEIEALQAGKASVQRSNGNPIAILNDDGSVAQNLKKEMPLLVSIAWCGQSNIKGNTMALDANGVWREASFNAPSQGIFEPTSMSPSGFGSMTTLEAELLANDGVKVILHNGAVGETSYYYDWLGVKRTNGRQNSTAYRGKRASLGTGDPGTRGECIVVNNATWEATTGNVHIVFANFDTPVTVNGIPVYRDPGYVIKETNLVTAASPPTFPGSPAIGNTVVDGGITWTCVATGAVPPDSGSIRLMRQTDEGFDPYFMCSRLRTAIMKSRVNTYKRFVVFQNGQTDAGSATSLYALALALLGIYFGQTPYLIKPIFCLDIYYPSHPQANWDLLETALSGGGLGTTPNYATSPLTTLMVGSGYSLGVLGEADANFKFYYGTSLYRALGTDVTNLLQPSSPHTSIEGAIICAKAQVPRLSQIVRNSAT